MRQEPTGPEQKAAESLAEAFRRDGHAVAFPWRDVQDKPDILMEVAGVLVACECTQIPPSRVYHHHVKRSRESDWEGLDLTSRTWPNEPHIWLADAIAIKGKRVPDYLCRTTAKEAWLLVHSPLESNQFFVQQDKEWVFRALRYSANMNKHSFSQVFLWTPQGGIQTLFARGLGNLDTRFDVDFKSGYPTCTVVRGYLHFRTVDCPDSPPSVVRYVYKTRNSKIMEPQDPEYAKHKPATRDAQYEFAIQSWSDRAVVECAVKFDDTGESMEQSPINMNGFSPGTNYTFHFLHEYAAPKGLHTTHR